MGDKQVDGKIVKKTQDTLGRIIKRPPLTDKLLQKPPFRFLHDVTTSVSILILRCHFITVSISGQYWSKCAVGLSVL